VSREFNVLQGKLIFLQKKFLNKKYMWFLD
jgi:hypothetical protein